MKRNVALLLFGGVDELEKPAPLEWLRHASRTAELAAAAAATTRCLGHQRT